MRRDHPGIDRAAAELRACSRAFTAKNLYHAYRRRRGRDLDFERFASGPLAARLARGAIPGLLADHGPWEGERLEGEWAAYFPRAIVLVDRPAIVDLFVASGVVATAKLAVVCTDGTPGRIVEWLRAGFRAGHAAPVAYLHDATTVFYPFFVEPLASAVASGPLVYRDLGLPPTGALASAFPFGSGEERVLELEALPPCAMLAYAVRAALALAPGDPLMAPLSKGGSR